MPLHGLQTQTTVETELKSREWVKLASTSQTINRLHKRKTAMYRAKMTQTEQFICNRAKARAQIRKSVESLNFNFPERNIAFMTG